MITIGELLKECGQKLEIKTNDVTVIDGKQVGEIKWTDDWLEPEGEYPPLTSEDFKKREEEIK